MNSARQRRSYTKTLPIANIILKERYRKDLGDISALAQSIKEVGLLHPIVVQPNNVLIAGKRRLEACKQLSWTKIPVTVIDLNDIALGQFHENVYRKDLLPTEIDAIRRVLEPQQRAAAKARQGTRTDKHPGKLPGSAGRVRDKIAAFAGCSGRQVDKIKAIVDAADSDARFEPLREKLDKTRNVDRAYRELKLIQKADRLRAEPPPLPMKGPYRVIVVDAPWSYDLLAALHRDPTPYPTMTLDEIKALPITSMAHQDCVLWLWTTNAHLPDAFDALSAWGFTYRTTLSWAKPRLGIGNWLRGQTEHCLLATRGKPSITLKNQSTLLTAPQGKHSEKPSEFYDLVESLCPAPRYVSLFHGAEARPNWDAHGDRVVPVKDFSSVTPSCLHLHHTRAIPAEFKDLIAQMKTIEWTMDQQGRSPLQLPSLRHTK
jgi:N6-adenosine-specific RNA methylase IME4